MSRTAGRRQTEFAPTSKAEQELIIRIDRLSGLAYICSAWPSRSRRLEKRYGPPTKVTTDQDGRVTACCWETSARQIGFHRPRKPGSGNPAALARAREARQRASLAQKPLKITRVRKRVLLRG